MVGQEGQGGARLVRSFLFVGGGGGAGAFLTGCLRQAAIEYTSDTAIDYVFENDGDDPSGSASPLDTFGGGGTWGGGGFGGKW